MIVGVPHSKTGNVVFSTGIDVIITQTPAGRCVGRATFLCPSQQRPEPLLLTIQELYIICDMHCDVNTMWNTWLWVIPCSIYTPYNAYH